MPVKGKRDKKSGRIAFDEWNLRAARLPEELIQNVLKEGMKLATEEYVVVAGFKPIKDEPSRFYVSLPIGTDLEEPSWFLSVTELIEDFIGWNEPFDEEDMPHAIKLRDHLRTLADRLDQFIPK